MLLHCLVFAVALSQPDPADRVLQLRVLDSRGALARDLSVEVQPAAGTRTKGNRPSLHRFALGMIDLRVPSPTRFIKLQLPSHRPYIFQVPQLGLADRVTIRMERSARVVGVVSDDRGRPISATVRIASGTRQKLLETIRTGSDGQFIAEVSPGTASLLFDAPGFSGQERKVRTPIAAPLRITLQPGTHIRGGITPQRSGMVRLVPTTPGVNAYAVAARVVNGQFLFRDVSRHVSYRIETELVGCPKTVSHSLKAASMSPGQMELNLTVPGCR